MDAAQYLGKMVQLSSYSPRKFGRYETVTRCGVLRHVLPAGELPSQELKDLRGAGYSDKSRASKYDRLTIQVVFSLIGNLSTRHITVTLDPTWKVELVSEPQFGE